MLTRWTYRDDGAVFGRMRTSLVLVQKLAGPRVLDVGCSNGWLADALTDEWRVMGIDVNWETGRAPTSLPVVQGTATTLPFKSSSFDTVTLFEVLEHVPAGSEVVTLREARRVLTAGGTLLLSTPQDHPAGTYLDPAWWLRGHRHYRQEHVHRFLTSAGFKEIQIGTSGGIAQTLYLPLMYLFKRLGLRTPLEAMWRRAIDREYKREGWYLIFATARAPASARSEMT